MTRRAKTITAIAVAALVILGAGVWWLFIRGDEPAAVFRLGDTNVDGFFLNSPGDFLTVSIPSA